MIFTSGCSEKRMYLVTKCRMYFEREKFIYLECRDKIFESQILNQMRKIEGTVTGHFVLNTEVIST